MNHAAINLERRHQLRDGEHPGGYTATENKDISFNLLHKEDGVRLKQLRWCPEHEKPVEWSEIARLRVRAR